MNGVKFYILNIRFCLQNLIKQSSESLAGRIVYKKLSPFLWEEEMRISRLNSIFHMGVTRSLLASDKEMSFELERKFYYYLFRARFVAVERIYPNYHEETMANACP